MSDGDEDWFERALRGDEEEDEGAKEGDGEESDFGVAGEESDFGVAGEESDFGGAGEEATSGGGGPFEEDFASAFESAPGPEGGGFGGAVPGEGDPAAFAESTAGGPTPEEFEEAEAEFESTIPRIDLGIEGLDEMILGGVPRRSLIAVVGSAGTGKTTFALQFLEEALSEGDRGVFLTLEESGERVLDTAEEKGWPFRTYAEEGRLAIVHLDPIEMVNSLASIRSELPALIDEFDADRLVLDSVSLLEMMYDHPSERRSEVYQFTRALKEAGVTTLVTSEASAETPYNSRYGIIEYLADAVLVLQYVRPSDFQETRLAVEIQKIRDANHSRQMKPYEISEAGLKVYRQANIF